MKKLPLLWRIRLLFAAVMGGLGVLACVILWALSRDAVARQVERDVAVSSEYLRNYFAEQEANLRISVRGILESPRFVELMSNDPVRHDRATMQEQLDSFRTKIGLDGLVYRDETGKPIASSGRVPKQLGTFRPSVFNMVKEPDGGHQAYVPVPGGFTMAYTIPVMIGKLQVGLLTGHRFVGGDTAKKLAKTLGLELAFVLEARIASATIPVPEMLPNDGKFHVETVSGVPYGMRFVATHTNFEGVQVGVMVMRSVHEVTEVYRRLMTAFVGLIVLAMLVGLALAGHYAKGITRPLDSVVRAATEIEAGRWPEKLEVTSTDELGLLQSVFNSMSESMRAAQDRLLALLDVDPLTELMNHRAFQEAIEKEAARCSGSGEPLSLLLIDMDKFKEFNAKLGHGAGDDVLRAVALVISEIAPNYATCARYGGEEFAVLLPGADLTLAECYADTIRVGVEGLMQQVTVSIGCAQLGLSTAKAEGLSIAADLALNRAKQLGRNRVCRFDSIPGADDTTDPYQLHKLLQDASLATIQALAAAVDAKDNYTRGHSQRVADYAAQLATFVGCTQSEVDLIYRTGTLHDVGKIGVPDDILKKPGRLTDEERSIMETHPVLGEMIVRKAPQLEETLPGVRHHHERWDGRGYPDGLAGDKIPYMARILALADTYDAMTSDRPYRKGMPEEVALAEIEKGAGTQFDPKLAPAFVEMLRGQELRVAA